MTDKVHKNSICKIHSGLVGLKRIKVYFTSTLNKNYGHGKNFEEYILWSTCMQHC